MPWWAAWFEGGCTARTGPIPQGRLARNAALNLIGQVVPLAVAVVTIPAVVHRLGPEQFGILSLAWVFVNYFAVFDLGLGRATTKRVAEAIGARDESRIPKLVWTAVLVQSGLGTLGGLSLAVATPFLVGHLLRIPAPLMADARGTFYVLSLSVPAILIAGSFRGVLEATQRFDLVNAVRIPVASANFVMPLVGVLLHWRLPGIVALLLIPVGVGVVAYFYLCTRVFPQVRAVPSFHRAEFRSLLTFGIWVTVSSVLGPVLIYLDRFMVGALLSIAAVGYYSAPYEMVGRLLIISGALVATLFPAFSTLGAQQQPETFDRLVARSTKYLLLALGPLVVLIVAFAPDILRLWLGPAFAAESSTALQIFAVGVFINSFAQIPYALVQAMGRPDVTAKFHLMEVPVHIALVWILVSRFGIAGAALAWSLRVTIDAALLFVAAERLSPLSLKWFLTSGIPRSLLALALFTGATALVTALAGAKAIQLVVVGVLLASLGVTVWRYLLDDFDRRQLDRFLGRAALVHSP